MKRRQYTTAGPRQGPGLMEWTKLADANRTADPEALTGIIRVDSERGRSLGFTSANFSDDSYLWAEPGRILCSLIFSRHRGAFRGLAAAILGENLAIAVPTPLGEMRRIVAKNGYVRGLEDGCEVWTLHPPQRCCER